MDFSYYIENTLPITIFELLAAFFGTYYIFSGRKKHLPTKILVIFLWITVFIEIIGSYSPIAYYSSYKYFAWVEGTKFAQSNWLYNPYLILSYCFYPLYFRSYIRIKTWKIILKYLVIFFLVTAILNLVFSDAYFTTFSQYTLLLGALLIFVSVGLFYFQLLRSEAPFNLKHYLPFYISIGTFFFHLCMTPIALYSKYFKVENIDFVDFRVKALLFSNILMYFIYIIGFIICRKKSCY